MMSVIARSLFRSPMTILACQKATMTSSKVVPSNLWSLGKLNHVAIATPDLQQSVSLYRDVMGASVRY